MSTMTGENWKGRRAALAIGVALLACLALAGSAVAGQDQLKGGSVVLQLRGSHGLKLKPSTLTLQITGGAVDPIDGSGTVQATGTFKARKGKGKTKVTIKSLTFGANGGPGSIAAKVGKKTIGSFAALRGGTVSRDGFGASIQGVSASLAAKGASALNRALNPKGKKGAKKSAKGGIKAGLPLGTVSATTIPQTIEVLPGGEMTLVSPLTLVLKLQAHCVDGLDLLDPGVSAIAPATLNPLNLAGPKFTFPIVGGTFAPDFSDGRIISAGGQLIKKNNGPASNLNCIGNTNPPVGTSVTQTDFETEFNLNSLSANAVLPTGPFGLAAVGDLHLDPGNHSFDPATGTVTLTDVPVTVSFLAAQTLNNVFPNVSGDSSNDFSTSDDLGTLSFTAHVR
jgi:hypothetical protein